MSIFKLNDGKEHAKRLANHVGDRLFTKYMAGQREHGGKLWRKDIVPHMIEEALDLSVYIFTHEAQMEHCKELLATAIVNQDWTPVKQVFNILEIGNPEGTPEEERQ